MLTDTDLQNIKAAIQYVQLAVNSADHPQVVAEMLLAWTASISEALNRSGRPEYASIMPGLQDLLDEIGSLPMEPYLERVVSYVRELYNK